MYIYIYIYTYVGGRYVFAISIYLLARCLGIRPEDQVGGGGEYIYIYIYNIIYIYIHIHILTVLADQDLSVYLSVFIYIYTYIIIFRDRVANVLVEAFLLSGMHLKDLAWRRKAPC